MGWIAEALDRRERRASSNVSNPQSWLFDALGGSKTWSGRRVGESDALQNSAVWAATRLLSSTSASLPTVTYERQETGKVRAFAHPTYTMLHDLVNERQTAFEWKETSMAHVLLRGNSWSLVERDRQSRATALWILDPRYMRPMVLPDNVVMWSWEPPDLPPIRALAGSGDMLHLRGFSSGDGVLGLSVLSAARQSMGLSLSAEEYGARFFDNGAIPGAVLEHPADVGEQALKRLYASLERYRGASAAHKNLILEEGMKWNSVGISPEDAQMLETRKFQVTEVARWFGVPPHMIGDLEKATFSNIEAQDLNFLRHSMRPWFVRFEQAIKRDLFTLRERRRLFVEWMVDGLLRGDSKARAESYSLGRQWGWLNVNEIREMENRNGIGPAGDVYLQPLNMVSLDGDPTPGAGGDEDESDEARAARRRQVRDQRARRSAARRRQIGEAMLSVFREAVSRIIRAERRELSKPIAALGSDDQALEKLIRLVARFYTSEGDLSTFARNAIGPAVHSLAKAIGPIAAEEVGLEDGIALEPLGDELARSFGERYAATSRSRLEGIIAANDTDTAALQVALDEQLDAWEETRADLVAQSEVTKEKGAIARRVFVAAGVISIRWVAFGENCPICDELDGQTVGIEQAFVGQGSEVGPEGNRIAPRTNITHPPIHDGCDCDIVAGG